MIPILLTGGFVAFVAAYAVAQHLANRKLEAMVAWLVGQNGRIRTALRAHGIDVDGEQGVKFDGNFAADVEDSESYGRHARKATT